MKTIQQVIREHDSKSIERAYFYKYPIELDELNGFEDITLGKIKERISKRIQDFIERLRTLEVENRHDEQSVLFVYKAQSDEASLGKEVGLLHAGELMQKDDLTDVQTYAYEFTEQKEALGFFVADTKLTQDNIMDVIVQFLYEISFFGYEQERLDQEKDELEKSIREIEEHPERLKKLDFDEIRKKYGLHKDEEYPEEHEKKNKFYEAAMDYANYCMCIEMERIKNILLNKKVCTSNS